MGTDFYARLKPKEEEQEDEIPDFYARIKPAEEKTEEVPDFYSRIQSKERPKHDIFGFPTGETVGEQFQKMKEEKLPSFGQVAGALATGGLRGIEAQAEFQDPVQAVRALLSLGLSAAGQEPIKPPFSPADILSDQLAQTTDDKEIQGIMGRLENVGAFLPWESSIINVLSGAKLLGQFTKTIARVAKARGENPLKTMKLFWEWYKNKLPKGAKGIEEGGVKPTEVITPEQAQEMTGVMEQVANQIAPIEVKPVVPKNLKGEEISQGGISPIEKTAEEGIKIQREKEETPFNELEAKPPELKETEFRTSKGSVYTVHPDGTTTRNKAERSEHPGEKGIQKTSQNTYYVKNKDVNKLAPQQATHPKGVKTRIDRATPEELAVFYIGGPNDGRLIASSQVPFSYQPQVGYSPIETWKDGEDVHFGNEITAIGKKEVSKKLLAREVSPKKSNVRPAETKLAEKHPVIGKKQAAKRSEILKLFRKAFNDPIRLGKISQRKALGIHKGWQKVSRLLKDNDIETAAHEIGHHLHFILYEGQPGTPQEQQQNVNYALRPYLDELKPLALYEPYGKEGFAEFTRLYVTNPDIALQEAPKFYAKFEADLDAHEPELKNALLQAREYYEQYLQGTPQSRIRAQTDYATDATFLDNVMDWIKQYGDLDFLKTQFLDDVFPAKRLVAEAFGIPVNEVENLKDERNLYRALRVLKGAIGKADVFLLHQTFDPMTLKRKGRGLRQIISRLKTDAEYKEFNDYLIARRVIEKGDQGIETGINYGDAIITERGLAPKYKRIAILLDKYNDSLLTYARDSGLLSGEQYSLIKQNNLMYTPFQRTMEKEKGTGTGKGLQAGKPIKRMKGSTRNIISPIESIIKNTYAIIINAEKNLAAQVLAKLADMKGVGAYVERVPTPMELKGKISKEETLQQFQRHLRKQGMAGEAKYMSVAKMLLEEMPDFFLRFGPGTYPAGENIVTVFNNGKPTYYEVSPELYQMWTKGIAPYTADLITRILRIPARTLRAGAILNPKFMQKNFIRDTWGGFLFTRYGKDIKDPVNFFIDTVYSPLAMLGVAAKHGKLYVEFMKAGGGMATMQSLDRDAVAKKVQEVKDGYQPHQIVKWLRYVAGISEESNRLAEFGRALAVEGETRLGKEIAAFASRDLSIDFAKMGLMVKALNQIIPFFNATIQGTDKFIRQASNPQTRNEFLARAIGFIAIPSLILAWLNHDDERVKEFYEEEKDFNFITFIGDKALKIPVPFETGVIMHGLTQRMYNYFIKKDPHAFEGFMGSIAEAMLPNFLPSFANPFVEAQANKSFFTGAPIIPKAKQDLIAKYQYKRGTSSTARLIGRGVTYMLGQETRSKAASPAIIDHFINSWGGGLGRLIASLADSSLEGLGLEDKVPGPEHTIIDKLGFDAFVSRYPRSSSRSIEKFYDNYADATARQKSFKLAKKEELEEPEELEKAYQRAESLYDYPTLQRAYKAMQMNQRAINSIWNNPDIEKDVKQKMVDDLYLDQIRFAKEANEDMEKHRTKKRAS